MVELIAPEGRVPVSLRWLGTREAGYVQSIECCELRMKRGIAGSFNLIPLHEMKDPVDAFAWLLEQFRKYARNEIIWTEVRKTFDEAEALCEQFRALQTTDDIALFGMAIRHEDRNGNGLAECTDDYLRRKIGQHDPTTAGYVSLLLWRRQQNAGH